ncbi:MAG TPA: glycosyltransferase family 4 protein, partial [Actinomycetota bacterium]|nr:glycosyltransferase family 4 protein [Actinomycetota bacterium]
FNRSVAPIAPVAGRATVRALARFSPDVVHVHEPLVPGPSMVATRDRAPVVATFHAYADRAALLSAAAPLLRRVWRRISVPVAVSEAARAFVAARFGDEGIRVVPNGVEVELFAQSRPADLPPGRPILFVNRLDPRKGFVVMVEAFEKLAASHPGSILVVAGDGPDRRAVGRLPSALRTRVVMLGSVPHEELPSFHAAAEVACAPAVGRESFGIVLVEAMASGLPVVASDIAGYREVVRHGVEGLLVRPRDPGELAGALARVMDDGVLAKRLGEAGRERAARYSWDRVTGEIEDLYRQATRA